MAEIQKLTTDVLVIGGGIAGCFAALEARKAGSEVILADKGYVSSSGQTPYAGTFIMFDPEKDNKEAWLQQIRRDGDYLANLDWTELVLDKSKECVDEMVEMGADFARDPEGNIIGIGDGCVAVVPECLTFPTALRKAVLKAGATIKDRTMMVELLVDEGKICGAIGMTVTDAQPVAIYAKSVIICTGGSALKPPGWPISNLTGDGDMMAYRAGVAVTGKEFVDTHGTRPENPNALAMNPFTMPKPGGPGGPPVGKPKGGDDKKKGPGGPPMLNALGQPVHRVPNLNLGIEFEIHSGNGPICSPGPMPGAGGPIPPKGPMVSCASHGLACHKTEGLWPAALDASTSLPGLYGAGDSLGTMMCGAAYAHIGLALGGSAVTGKVAGQSASAYSKDTPLPPFCEKKLEEMFATMYAPLERKGGFTPDWLIAYLQNITMPYFVLIIKEEERLKNVLSQVRYAKAHIVPKLYADNDHDLRVAIEAKNMVENLEIKLVAALARQESRGTHFREDYPDRNEESFSAWLTVRQVDGTPTVEKHPLPEAWAWKEGDPRLVTFPTQF